MAWCRQAASHYLSQCWPRSLSPYGVTRPQWVNLLMYICVTRPQWYNLFKAVLNWYGEFLSNVCPSETQLIDSCQCHMASSVWVNIGSGNSLVLMAPSHYLNPCGLLGNCILRNKPRWNLNQNIKRFILQNAFENVVSKMSAILFKSQCVKHTGQYNH